MKTVITCLDEEGTSLGEPLCAEDDWIEEGMVTGIGETFVVTPGQLSSQVPSGRYKVTRIGCDSYTDAGEVRAITLEKIPSLQ